MIMNGLNMYVNKMLSLHCEDRRVGRSRINTYGKTRKEKGLEKTPPSWWKVNE